MVSGSVGEMSVSLEGREGGLGERILNGVEVGISGQSLENMQGPSVVTCS